MPGETGVKGLEAAVLGAVLGGRVVGGAAMKAPTEGVVSSGGNPREVVTRKPGRDRVLVTFRSSNVSRCAMVRRIASLVISAPARLVSFSQTAKAWFALVEIRYGVTVRSTLNDNICTSTSSFGWSRVWKKVYRESKRESASAKLSSLFLWKFFRW